MTLRTRVVTTAAELSALGPVWDEVLARSETATPFLTHEWISTWWESFGAGMDLCVVLLQDDDGTAAIAPWARARRRAGPVTYRTLEILGTGPLRFLGMGLSDRSDLLLARRGPECVAALLAWLRAERGAWDVVDFRFLPADGTTAGVLAERARDSALGLASEPCSRSPYLPLAGTWEDYVAARGKSFRQRVARGLRKLEASGTVRFETDAADLDPARALRAAIDTSLRSWKERAGSALFLHERVRTFFEALVPRLARRRAFFTALLRVGDEVVAHELGFRTGNKLWSYDSAYLREHAGGSPGMLLTAKVLEHAFRDGLSEYDFLRGAEGYKAEWTSAARREVQLVLHAGTARARLAFDLEFRAKWALKRSPALVRGQARAAGLLRRITARRSPK